MRLEELISYCIWVRSCPLLYCEMTITYTALRLGNCAMWSGPSIENLPSRTTLRERERERERESHDNNFISSLALGEQC